MFENCSAPAIWCQRVSELYGSESAVTFPIRQLDTYFRFKKLEDCAVFQIGISLRGGKREVDRLPIACEAVNDGGRLRVALLDIGDNLL